MFVCVLEYINQIDSRLRRTDIMFLLHLLLGAAVGTRIAVGLEIEITDTDRRLDVPMLTQEPGITVAQTDARAPALMTFVLGAENLDVRNIIYKVRNMETYEMPVEGFAEPIAHLRMEAEMFEGTVVRPIIVLAIEGIQPGLDIKRPFGGKTELQPGIKCSRSPIRDVGFQSHDRSFAFREEILRMVWERQAKQQH